MPRAPNAVASVELEEFIGVEAQAAVSTRARAVASFFMANISPLCLRVLYRFELTGAPTPHLHARVAAPEVKE
jgi:hypothetical protein